MHEVVVERRHQIEIADLLLLDQFQRACHFEARQAHERAADERHRQERAHAHGVIERHHAERAFARPVEVLRHMGQRRGPFRALPPRHALGFCGGARRIEHHRPRLGIGTRQHRAVARSDQCFERIVRGKPDGDPRHCTRRLRSLHRVGRHRLIDQRLRLGILQAIVQFVGGGAPVQRRDDDAGELACPVDRRRLPVVLQHCDEMVAGLELQGVEARHQRRNPAVPLGIGEAHAAVDDGERMGVARDAGEEACAEIEHGWRRFGLRCSLHRKGAKCPPMNKHDLQPKTGTAAGRQRPEAGSNIAGLARSFRRRVTGWPCSSPNVGLKFEVAAYAKRLDGQRATVFPSPAAIQSRWCPASFPTAAGWPRRWASSRPRCLRNSRRPRKTRCRGTK